jgi:hypothetical protein
MIEAMAERIAEGVWDVPAIETREEFKAAVVQELRPVLRALAVAEQEVKRWHEVRHCHSKNCDGACA